MEQFYNLEELEKINIKYKEEAFKIIEAVSNDKRFKIDILGFIFYYGELKGVSKNGDRYNTHFIDDENILNTNGLIIY